MHAVGVTHRDVKLENIFLDASGAVKLGDFDLAVFNHEAQVCLLCAVCVMYTACLLRTYMRLSKGHPADYLNSSRYITTGALAVGHRALRPGSSLLI